MARFDRKPWVFALGALVGGVVALVALALWQVATVEFVRQEVWCFRTSERTWVLAPEEFSRRARWSGAGWEWIPRSESEHVGDGVLARWLPGDGLDVEYSGEYRAGVLVTKLAELSDARPRDTESPWILHGHVDADGRPVGPWEVLDGLRRRLADGDHDSLGDLTTVRGFHPSGAALFAGQYHSSDACGAWHVRYESGQTMARWNAPDGPTDWFDERGQPCAPLAADLRDIPSVRARLDAIGSLGWWDSESRTTRRIGVGR